MEWVILLLVFWIFYEVLIKVTKNMGEAYTKAALNEQFGCEVVKEPRIYMLSGTYSGCCENIVETLKCMGCRSTV